MNDGKLLYTWSVGGAEAVPRPSLAPPPIDLDPRGVT